MINEALTQKGSIEYFRNGKKYYAIENGTVHRVIKGSKYYLTLIELMVKHPHYSKFKASAKADQDLVFLFIDNYLSGFNNIPDVVDGELNDFDGDIYTVMGKISPREKQIIFLSSEGNADKQIGNILGIATNTVVSIFQHLREKTGATSKYHIIAKAAKAGII